jgi:hypothetical protein
MCRIDDQHLRRQGSTQLTQSVCYFVIHRKLSHGTRTDDGERFAERALSAAATCRQQGRSLSEFLTELITAHNRGDPLPALT